MNWFREFESRDKEIFWRGFTPIRDDEIQDIEKKIGRSLPNDFRAFLLKFGCGYFPEPFGGEIYSPDMIVDSIGVPIYYVIGSMTPGKEWATASQHRDLWLTKGMKNPNPKKFTDSIFNFHGMSLLNFLQIGSDGMAGYQMLNLDESSPTQYLVISESSQISFASSSFQEGIIKLTDWYSIEDE